MSKNSKVKNNILLIPILSVVLLILLYVVNFLPGILNLNKSAFSTPCSVYENRSSCNLVNGCAWVEINCSSLSEDQCELWTKEGCSYVSCADTNGCFSKNNSCYYIDGHCQGSLSCIGLSQSKCVNGCLWVPPSCNGGYCKGPNLAKCIGKAISTTPTPSNIGGSEGNNDKAKETCSGICSTRYECRTEGGKTISGKCPSGEVCCKY